MDGQTFVDKTQNLTIAKLNYDRTPVFCLWYVQAEQWTTVLYVWRLPIFYDKYYFQYTYIEIGYNATSDFKNSYEISDCSSGNYFSVIPSNIRSLNANFDGLLQMLTEMNHSFSLIGLTETKYTTSQESLHCHNIPGYIFTSQPSLSNAGGTGFFVSDKLNFHVRDDLSESTVDYECLCIDIPSKFKDDLIRGVIYRHPNSNPEAFWAFLNKSIGKINRENKYCIFQFISPKFRFTFRYRRIFKYIRILLL